MAVTPTELGHCCGDCAVIIVNDDDSGMEASRAVAVRNRIEITTCRENGYLVVTNSDDPDYAVCCVCLDHTWCEYQVFALVEN